MTQTVWMGEHYEDENDATHSQEGGDEDEDFSSDPLCCF